MRSNLKTRSASPRCMLAQAVEGRERGKRRKNFLKGRKERGGTKVEQPEKAAAGQHQREE